MDSCQLYTGKYTGMKIVSDDFVKKGEYFQK